MSPDVLQKWLFREVGYRFPFEPTTLENMHKLGHSSYALDETDGEIVGLSLSNLGLVAIPDVISELSTLKVLRLAGNALLDCPPWIMDLSNLTSLYLGLNNLREIPPVVFELKGLRVLGLNQNSIGALPLSVTHLGNLERLGLSRNAFNAFPSALLELAKLQSLFIGSNKIGEIPQTIGRMPRLKELDLSNNPIKQLPVAISELTNLRELSLANTELRSLPPVLFQLYELAALNLSGLRVKDLPSDVGNLTELRSLNIGGTEISSLPPALANLRKLRGLDMRGLKLGKMPKEIFELALLSDLNLSGARVKAIPDQISRLRELQRVDLSGMELASIPGAIFSLAKIQLLNLAGNRLRELPSQIVDSHLDIFWSKAARRGVLVEGNPLESPPPEIVQKGRPAVDAYFRSKGDRKSVDEVKVLLVGDGGAGKTSLVKRILGAEFDENERQTHGIKIDDWSIPSAGKHVRVHLWDFGGQEIMHATHQFFLSKRSAYILVLDGRRDEKTEYWLKHVESFGGDSPVLVVINKIDQNPFFDVNRRFLVEKFANIKGFFRTSCASGQGIDDLRRSLSKVISRVEHTKTFWPRSWFDIKERIESISLDFISFDRFRNICVRSGVHEASEQETLIGFLNDLGVAIWFNDLPLRDTNVISPRWLTDGVYRIINSDAVARGHGILELGLLQTILDPKTYPPEKHDYLIELMKKFELCYEITSDQILLPSLLPVDEPKYSAGQDPAVRFFVDYDFMPKSIMPRFIVRMHSDILSDLRWRTGVVLHNAILGAQAIVRVDEEERRIEITAWGEQRRDYLSAILHTLQTISQTFERIKYVEKVPMPDRTDVTISYDHLIRLESKGIRSYIPDGTEKEYDVQDLLGRVKPQRKTEQEILEILRELRARNDTESTLLQKANKSILLQPNFLGVGININELIRRAISRK